MLATDTFHRASDLVGGSQGTGADLHGWSALPLLGSTRSTASWLYVLRRDHAWRSDGGPMHESFTAVPGNYCERWGLDDGVAEGVVIDGDTIATGKSNADLDRVLTEAQRVASSENVLIVCGHRLLPRRLRSWREYGTHSADRWRRSAGRLGMQLSEVGFVRFSGERVTELMPRASAARAQLARAADRIVLRLSPGAAAHSTLLEQLVADASSGAGFPLRVEAVTVRKIGKTAVFLAGADGRQYVMRIARSPIAKARAARNHATLESMRHASVPAAITHRTPAPVVNGGQGVYPYYVETRLGGKPGPFRASKALHSTDWARDAVEFITMLHVASCRPTLFDAAMIESVVREPLARLTNICDSAGELRVIRQLERACEASLGNSVVPMVTSHGDFTEANCLFDLDGRLTAVVDWEVSSPTALPLLDLLQLMPVPGEARDQRRWRRFDVWLELWREPQRVVTDSFMGPYLRSLAINPTLIPGLVLMQWVTHVADRIDARRGDERWMRLRVHQPIESLKGAL